jgi:hypothetical protein
VLEGHRLDDDREAEHRFEVLPARGKALGCPGYGEAQGSDELGLLGLVVERVDQAPVGQAEVEARGQLVAILQHERGSLIGSGDQGLPPFMGLGENRTQPFLEDLRRLGRKAHLPRRKARVENRILRVEGNGDRRDAMLVQGPNRSQASPPGTQDHSGGV